MKYYEPCYEACEKCEYGGNKINNNCILCEFGYISIEGINNTFNCIIKCPYYFYYTKYGQYKCSKLTVCPEDYYLLIREKDQCIEDCKKDGEYNLSLDSLYSGQRIPFKLEYNHNNWKNKNVIFEYFIRDLSKNEKMIFEKPPIFQNDEKNLNKFEIIIPEIL
jgi:hypothetical protein